MNVADCARPANGSATSGRCGTSTCRCRPTRCWAWLARTVPARRRCCTCWSGWPTPTRVRSRCSTNVPGTAAVLPDIAFVAQDAPLPRRMRVADVVDACRRMNPRWDAALVADRLAAFELDPKARLGTLSGGLESPSASSRHSTLKGGGSSSYRGQRASSESWESGCNYFHLNFLNSSSVLFHSRI